MRWKLSAFDDNPLLLGLTSLQSSAGFYEFKGILAYQNAAAVAIKSRESIEALCINPIIHHLHLLDANTLAAVGEVVGAALTTLGVTWPLLRSLTLFVTPSTLHRLFERGSMPSLTELCLNDCVDAADLAALSNAGSLASNLQVLELNSNSDDTDEESTPEAWNEIRSAMKTLLEGMPQLRRIELGTGECPSLDFLGVELPSIEVIKLFALSEVSLESITCIPRPLLRTLYFNGGNGIELAPLVSSGAAALTALENLTFDNFSSSTWDPFLEIGLWSLKTLTLFDCDLTEEDASDLKAGLARLPVFTTFKTYPAME